ncbi:MULTISPECIES: hypothetical protein [Lactococcus]|uniref:hypothetical protein n=1 Tax=Lactococcus TaxID=1357 RepID=UPI0010BF1F6F|nr:hypothetical protein [Lactococcus lactis]MDS1012913.1 hypothetical protein [Lactococcus lactis]NLS47316.1 hypothetical protein [Lactococcus lactis]TKD78634.1 hypothetical protein E6O52_02955 [Lactococcus lactis]UXV69012.1 hypothetical protein LLUL021_04285 [Lactococcus lactis subsp. lactis]
MNPFKKTAFRYEMTNCVNFRATEVSDAYELINWIIAENLRLQELKVNGSVTLTKVKTTAKGEQEIYSAALTLPVLMDDEEEYDDWLEFFYATQPVKEKDRLEKGKSFPKVMRFERPKVVEQETPDVKAYAPAPDLSVMDEEPEKWEDEDKARLSLQVRTQEAEIERLKQQLNQSESKKTQEEPETIESPMPEPLGKTLSVSKAAPIDSSDVAKLLPLLDKDSVPDSTLKSLGLLDKAEITQQVQDSFQVFYQQELEKERDKIEATKAAELKIAKQEFDEKERAAKVEAQKNRLTTEQDLKEKYELLIFEESQKRLEAQREKVQAPSEQMLSTLLRDIGFEEGNK